MLKCMQLKTTSELQVAQSSVNFCLFITLLRLFGFELKKLLILISENTLTPKNIYCALLSKLFYSLDSICRIIVKRVITEQNV